MGRHSDCPHNDYETGWYVCDIKTARLGRAEPIHEEPASQEEARELAAMLNDENDSWNGYPH